MSLTGSARPATAADVAARAGVSRATVSHILNGREARFPEETRQRVRDAVAALDYRPSPAGRSLVTGRGDTIVVLMPSTTMSLSMQDTLERLAENTQSLGSNVVLRFADPEPDATVTAILKLRPLGVVHLGSLSAAARDRLASQGVPTVPSPDHPVTYDGIPLDSAIVELQVAELIRNGPRRVLYASPADQRPDFFAIRRVDTLEQVCARHGLPAPSHIRIPLDAAGAADLLQSVLGPEPVGVAAYNDHVALAVLAGAARLGAAVPADLSVIGVDHVDVGHLWSPTLSTIEVDLRAFADVAADQLRAMLDGADLATIDSDRGRVTLIHGGST